MSRPTARLPYRRDAFFNVLGLLINDPRPDEFFLSAKGPGPVRQTPLRQRRKIDFIINLSGASKQRPTSSPGSAGETFVE